MSSIRTGFRSRFGITGLVILLMAMTIVGVAISSSDDASAGEQYTVSHGVDDVVVPVELQREALTERLATARAYRASIAQVDRPSP